jgi:hypothetical protein
VVNGLEERASALAEKRDHLSAKTAEERTETQSLAAKTAAIREELSSADKQLASLNRRLETLRPSLPPRLSDALELPFRSIADPELGSSARIQHLMTILGRCAQFNRQVTSGEEVISIEGTAKSLEVIYWGLSHGYALDRPAGKVWLGSPHAGQWKWEPSIGAAKEVERLIAIYHDKADPAFVTVPTRLSSISADSK